MSATGSFAERLLLARDPVIAAFQLPGRNRLCAHIRKWVGTRNLASGDFDVSTGIPNREEPCLLSAGQTPKPDIRLVVRI